MPMSNMMNENTRILAMSVTSMDAAASFTISRKLWEWCSFAMSMSVVKAWSDIALFEVAGGLCDCVKVESGLR